MTELKRENNTVKFEMILKAEDVKAAEDTVYKKNRKYFQVPGFRKGKVPRKIIENVYGKEVFLEDAINEILPEKYQAMVEELKIEVVDQPQVNIEEAHSGEDVKVEISVDVKPEVKIENYKGLEVEDIKYEVTEELLDNEIDQQRRLNARVINIDDRAAEDGDKVNIDFLGTVDGVEFEGGAGESQDLVLGSNTFIPGFEKQIEGHKIGEEFDVNVIFPEDYFSEDLKGKEAVFAVKLNSISKEELPELDDEFIKDISEFDTVEEYKNDLREKKAKQFEDRSLSEKKEAIAKKLVEMVEVDVPKGMVDAQINTQMQNFDQNLRSQGMNLEDYLGMIGVDMKDFAENLRGDATAQVKRALALEKVAEIEGISPTEEDIDKEIDDVVNMYFKDDEEQKNKMKEYMNETNRAVIKDDLMSRKALDFLYENAKFVEPSETEESEEEKVTE